MLKDGRYRLDGDWRWTCGDRSRERSTIEEKDDEQRSRQKN
jgi:hypothetical protein